MSQGQRTPLSASWTWKEDGDVYVPRWRKGWRQPDESERPASRADVVAYTFLLCVTLGYLLAALT